MKCMILAAGYATRLYPLTENFPKPLLCVGEKTILDWLLDDLEKTCDVKEYIIISNHRFITHFEKWAEGKKLPVTVLDDGSTDNDNRLGAVKDIAFAIEKTAPEDDLLVMAGDNVLDFSLSRFVEYAQSKQTACLMRYYEADIARLRKGGVMEVDASDKVLSMEEKPQNPKANWCVPPFYYYPRDVLPLIARGIEEGCQTDAPGSFAAWLCKETEVYAMEMPGKRYDIGNLQSLEAVRATYKGIL